MINMDAAIAKYNGKPVDFDGMYGPQCVDLVAAVLRDNGLPVMYADAANWFNNFSLPGAYDKIPNNPNDPNQLPQRGDIMVWSGAQPGSGGAGHIALVNSVSPSGFVSFDQNWGGQYAHLVSHNWSYILGWLRPKAAAPQPSQGEPNMDAGQERQAYQIVLGREPEAGANLGHRTGYQFIVAAQPELAAQRQQRQQQLDSLSGTINQLNQTVTQLNSQSAVSKQQLTDALAKVTDLTSQLETAHDKITDLENQPPKEVIKEVNPSWLQKAIDFINNVLGKKG